MKRRRYATRDELVELLAARAKDIDRAAVSAVIQELADLGAPVDALVKITTDEG